MTQIILSFFFVRKEEETSVRSQRTDVGRKKETTGDVLPPVVPSGVSTVTVYEMVNEHVSSANDYNNILLLTRVYQRNPDHATI